jgi:hypothetical protein
MRRLLIGSQKSLEALRDERRTGEAKRERCEGERGVRERREERREGEV